MAKPIAPTPTLRGKDIDEILEEMNSASPDSEKTKFLEDCKKLFQQALIK